MSEKAHLCSTKHIVLSLLLYLFLNDVAFGLNEFFKAVTRLENEKIFPLFGDCLNPYFVRLHFLIYHGRIQKNLP
jgi:hypothetical protein